MRSRRRALLLLPAPTLLLLLTAIFVYAAAPPRASAQDSSTSTGYTVHGTVIDAISGKPIGRALIALNDEFSVLTGGQGEFSFDDVSAGDYDVSILKPGYQGFGRLPDMILTGGAGAPDPPQRVRVGPEMPALTFRISPLGTIDGHVTLSTADSADAVITAYTRQIRYGRAPWIPAGTARTRSDGSFHFGRLRAGDYILSIHSLLDSGVPPNSSPAPVWGYPTVYYPGGSDDPGAGTVSLHAGQRVEAEISLVRQQFFPVTASIRVPGNGRNVQFLLTDSSGQRSPAMFRYDRGTGTARGYVPNGEWSLAANLVGDQALSGRADFKVAGLPVNLAVTPVPLPRIAVNIRREDTAGTTDGLQPHASGPGLNFTLMATTDNLSSSLGAGGLVAADGNKDGEEWQLRVVLPGRYWILAQATPPDYIASITSGGVDLAENPLTVDPESGDSPIEIVLRNDAGSITGQIEEKAGEVPAYPPPSGKEKRVWIYAIPLFATTGDLATGSARADGKFTLSNLAPGSYRVVACDTPQQIEFHSAEALAAWAEKGETVTVEAGSAANVNLSLVSTEASQ